MEKPITRDLNEIGYSYVENLIDKEQCSMLIEEIEMLKMSKLKQQPLLLNDSTNQCNILYNSIRSPMSYGYLKTEQSDNLSQVVMNRLKDLTLFSWSNNINSVCQPIFIYSKGQFIKEHRGRNVGYGSNDYVAVVMISQPELDFTAGQFFLNRFGEASEDGKTIFNEDKSKRQFFNIKQGDALIFNNNLFIHGTTPVETGEKINPLRITTSWRTSK